MQYVLDPDDGLLKLLEVNPRFWGVSPLARHAGVGFPHLLYRLVVNGDAEPVQEYRIGTYFRWFLPADILWLCHADRSLRQGREFFRFRRPDQCYAVCSASDPFPIVGAVLKSAFYLRKKTARELVLKRSRQAGTQRRRPTA